MPRAERSPWLRLAPGGGQGVPGGVGPSPQPPPGASDHHGAALRLSAALGLLDGFLLVFFFFFSLSSFCFSFKAHGY